MNLPSVTGETALIEAVSDRNPDLVNLLIKSGADVNHAVTKGDTVLQIAIVLKHKSCVDTLLVAGADVNALNKINGSTALHCAAETGQNTIVENTDKSRS